MAAGSKASAADGAAARRSAASRRRLEASTPNRVWPPQSRARTSGPMASARRNASCLRFLARSVGKGRGRGDEDETVRPAGRRRRARRGWPGPRSRRARGRRTSSSCRPERRPTSLRASTLGGRAELGHRDDRDVGERTERRRPAAAMRCPAAPTPGPELGRRRPTAAAGVAPAGAPALGLGDAPERRRRDPAATRPARRRARRARPATIGHGTSSHRPECDRGSPEWPRTSADRGTPRPGGRTGRREMRKMADPTGFEPAISSVTGWHVGPLHHGSSCGEGGA